MTEVISDALKFHKYSQDGHYMPGKVSMAPTKKLTTSRELSLAYSPGVAEPCIAIEKNPELAYEYTSKGNYVAVISNGTAVLGLGDLGSLASKPVMEGKSVLFKRFAGIDSVDIELNIPFFDKDKKYIEGSVERIIDAVVAIGDTWGGINLEDICSPYCFEIEEKIKAQLDIPVFHDDQHGTAIICLAGLMNACEISKRKLNEIKVVINGSGAAGIACLELMKTAGVKSENIILCDSTGPIYKGRNESMNDLKAKYAVETNARNLGEALVNADVFIGLSVKDVLTREMIMGMAKNPLIFAMANPDPEIKPEIVYEARPDAIVGTGRSDYPNQVNNVMGFPYIFRGALDVRAKTINEQMKLAAAHAIANLAKKDIPAQVIRAYPGRELKYGPNYIIPTPFDPRLISEVSAAVAKAACETGVARRPISDFEEYKRSLQAHTNPSLNSMNAIFKKLQRDSKKKKIVFAEGEEANVIRAAIEMQKYGFANVILVGREDKINLAVEQNSISQEDIKGIEIQNAALSKFNEEYTNIVFKNLSRHGFLHRDCERLVKTDRNIFASALVKAGHADSVITGYTRGYKRSLNDIMKVCNKKTEEEFCGFCVVVAKNKTIIIGDTSVHENPTAEVLAGVAKSLAKKAKLFDLEPRVAFISYSVFGSREGEEVSKIRDAIKILDNSKVDFEYDGEMTVDVALSENPQQLYPFNRLSKSATILITNGLSPANMAVGLISQLFGDESVILGPVLSGLEESVQIMKTNSEIDSIINLATISLANV